MATDLSEETVEAVKSLRGKHARDVNCLSDENRHTRKNGVAALTRVLRAAPDAVAAEYFVADLVDPLLGVCCDAEVDSNREKALTLVEDVFERLPQVVPPCAGRIIPMIESRLAAKDSEEVRMLQMQLLHVVLGNAACATTVADCFSGVVDIVSKSGASDWADMKNLMSKCVMALASVVPTIVHRQLEPLVTMLLGNLSYRKGPVRQAALKALAVILPLGSEGLDKLMTEGGVLQCLQGLAHNENPSVRRDLGTVVGRLIVDLPTRAPYESPLTVVLLTLMSDSYETVQGSAFSALEAAGNALLAEAGSPPPDTPPPEVGALPPPFTRRPSQGARHLVVRLLESIVRVGVTALDDWKAPVRLSAAGMLQSAVVFVEEAVVGQLGPLFGGLCRATNDDEAAVRGAVASCAAMVGKFADAASQLEVLLPQVRGEVSGLTSGEHRASTLVVLAAALSGMSIATLSPHVEDLAASLSDPALTQADPPHLRAALLGAVSALVATSGAACGDLDISRALAVVLLQLQASDVEPEVAKGAKATAEALATALDLPSVLPFYDRCAGDVLDALTASGQAATWDKTTANRLAFDSLLRAAAPSVAKHMDAVIGVFAATLNPSREPDLRIAMIALLDTFVGGVPDGTPGGDVLDAAIVPFSDRILYECLMPNVVWRVGRVAATIRKVALACFFTMLRRELIPGERAVAFATTPDNLKPLVTSTSDDDSSLRHVSCLVLARLFHAVPGALADMNVWELKKELVKLLDDSSDQVRVAACTMLKHFAKAAPPEAMAPEAGYVVDCLIIHLDDLDAGIREAVYGALVVFGSLDAEATVKKAATERTKHRSPDLLDRLVKELQATP